MPSLEVSRRFPASALSIDNRGTEFVLRPLALSDAKEITTAVNESLAELKPFMPWAHIPQTLEGQLQRIRASLSPAAEGRDIPVGLFNASSGRFLVGGGLHPRAPLNPSSLEIGYWTRSCEAGRGLATLMTKMMIVYAFEGLGCDRIQISHNRENEASRKVIEKCGFKFEGVLRNIVAAPSPEVLEGGLSPCREFPAYALLPEDREELPWYRALRDSIHVTDLLGEARGFLWRT
jgi:RimJ/RimL family protein N-acetyltransferase